MKLGTIDLSPYEYLLVYKRKDNETINTLTLGESALRVNYPKMKRDKNVEFIGIYKNMSTEDLLDVMCKKDYFAWPDDEEY